MTRSSMSAFAALLLCGCSTVLNPYQSSFNCPETENGKCVSVQTAYRESLNPLVKSEGGDCPDCGKHTHEEMAASSEEKGYRAALLNRLPVREIALYKDLTVLHVGEEVHFVSRCRSVPRHHGQARHESDYPQSVTTHDRASSPS